MCNTKSFFIKSDEIIFISCQCIYSHFIGRANNNYLSHIFQYLNFF